MKPSAAVRVAEADLARLQEQQRFSTVRAPFDGVISARNFDRGDLARGDSAGTDDWLYRLDRLDTLRFVVHATPDLALRFSKDGEAAVRFGEFPGYNFSARVAHISRVFDTASGTMRVELLLENKDLALPSGLTGSATFDVKPAANTYLVPTNVLISREGKILSRPRMITRCAFWRFSPAAISAATLRWSPAACPPPPPSSSILTPCCAKAISSPPHH